MEGGLTYGTCHRLPGQFNSLQGGSIDHDLDVEVEKERTRTHGSLISA